MCTPFCQHRSNMCPLKPWPFLWILSALGLMQGRGVASSGKTLSHHCPTHSVPWHFGPPNSAFASAPYASKSACAVAEENLALLRGGRQPAADPLYRRYLRLAGHWWEQKRSKRETRRPLGGAKKQANLRQRILT